MSHSMAPPDTGPVPIVAHPGRSDRTPAIEVRHLTKIYGQRGGAKGWSRGKGAGATHKPAAKDVEFTVGEGEFFVIMGLSGSGKSTVLRMLNRLVEPTSGEILLDGKDIVTMADPELRAVRNRKINMVFQHFALFPHRTVRENAAYALHVRKEGAAARTERANWALETVGLGEWGDSLPGELSGGMRQRVGLARALASDADILLMDEPFSALDPLIRRDMQELLIKLQAELRRTVVFVTHDLNEAMRLGDRIMIMRQGEVVQLGTATEILESPADDYVREFISDVDRSRVLTAGVVMQPPIAVGRPGDRPSKVLERMNRPGAHAQGAYVLDADSRILGVVEGEAIAGAVHRPDARLEDLARPPLGTIRTETTLSEACTLVGGDCVPLAVLDHEDRLVGVLPRATLLQAIATPAASTSEGDRHHA